MKTLLFYFILLYTSVSKLYCQTSGVVWKKDVVPISPTMPKYLENQGLAVDSLNYLYVAYSSQNYDTTCSFISRYTPWGELLWRRTLKSNMGYSGIYTNTDPQANIIIDNSNCPVFMAYGFDTSTENDILLYRFDSLGNLLAHQGFKTNLPNLGTFCIHRGYNKSLSRYHYSFYNEVANAESVYTYFFDEDFNFLFLTTVTNSISHMGELAGAGGTTVHVLDSTIIYKFGVVNPDQTNLRVVNIYSGQQITNQILPGFIDFYKIFNYDSIYVFVGEEILKMSKTGNILKRLPFYGGMQSAQLSGDYIDFFRRTNLNLFQAYQSQICRYHIPTDSIQLINLHLPGIDTIMLGSLWRKEDFFYAYGFYFPFPYTSANTYSAKFFIKLDTLGNVNDYFLCDKETNEFKYLGFGAVQDNNSDFLVWEEITKNPDTLTNTHYHYLFKGSFQQKPNLKGTCYFDENENCIRDIGEFALSNRKVKLYPEDIYTMTDSTGNYQFTKPFGTAQIIVTPFNYDSLCTYSIVINCDTTIRDSLDFAFFPQKEIHCNPQIVASAARPGFVQNVNCIIKNNNVYPQYAVSIEVQIDSAFNFQNSSELPDSIIDNRYFWVIDTILPNSSYSINLQLTIPVSVSLGYSYKHQLKHTFQYKAQKCHGKDTTTGIVVGSFDPNDKQAEPIGDGPFHYISNETRLKYTIRFQNTGTDTAFQIRIKDTLSEHLDINSFSVLGASHPYEFKLKGHILEVYFNNILLPDSHRNALLSQGFFQYSLSPLADKSEKEILNKAEIYFDYNPSISTNTTKHTIGVWTPPIPGILLVDCFPNPNPNANLIIHLSIPEDDFYSIKIFDAFGRQFENRLPADFLNKGVHEKTIPLNLPSAGIYILKIESKNKKHLSIKKLIISS